MLAIFTVFRRVFQRRAPLNMNELISNMFKTIVKTEPRFINKEYLLEVRKECISFYDKIKCAFQIKTLFIKLKKYEPT